MHDPVGRVPLSRSHSVSSAAHQSPNSPIHPVQYLFIIGAAQALACTGISWRGDDGVGWTAAEPVLFRAMRIVAGELRGRRLVAPGGGPTRPTTDKVREAVFNALASLDVVVDARVADLYAGSGALGIEALSRGAAHCTFVERDRGAVAAIDENIATLGLRERSRVIVGDGIAAAPQLRPTSCSPTRPTASTTGRGSCAPCRPTLVVAEAAAEVPAPPAGSRAGSSATAGRGSRSCTATATRNPVTPAPALRLRHPWDRAQPRQLRPDPPRARRRRRAGRRAVRPRDRRRDAQPREDRRAVPGRAADRADPGERRRGRPRRARRRRGPRRSGHRRRRGVGASFIDQGTAHARPTSRSSSRWP